MRWLPLTVLLCSCTCASSHEADAGDSSSPDTTTPPPDTTVVPDIGPPDGPVVTDCLSGFDAVDGQRCDFEDRCYTADLCCGSESACFDGVLRSRSADDRCFGPSMPTACRAATMTRIDATTPLGPIDLPFLHASFSFALAVDVMLIWVGDVSLETCALPRLSVYFGPSFVDPSFTYVGTHEAIAQLVTEDGVARARATVEITAEDLSGPGVLEGHFEVDADGWRGASATFQVRGCEDIDRSGP